MGSSSQATSPSTSNEYSNSLNTTVANTVGQSGFGVSLGSLSGGASNNSLIYLANSDNPSSTITKSNSSNVGSGSAGGASVAPVVSNGTSPGLDFGALSAYLPYILLAVVAIVAYFIVKRS
jgi:hypothetical protein